MERLRAPRQAATGALRSRSRRTAAGAETSGRIDSLAKWVSIVAVVVAGAWGLFKWYQAGAGDWMINMEIRSEVLPYADSTRLLFVHLKLKNPADHSIEFQKTTSSYKVSVYGIPGALKPNTVIDGTKGPKLATVDLMPDDGYLFLPFAEFEDTALVVVPKDSTVFVSAELTRRGDSVSVEQAVVVTP